LRMYPVLPAAERNIAKRRASRCFGDVQRAPLASLSD
jgi:hypothetical protein